MNGGDLAYLLKDVKTFGGVFAKDQLPRDRKKKTLIVNTKPSTHPGEHWIVLDYTTRKPTFFDSFGQSPTFYNFQPMSFSRRILQGNSDLCGVYCMYYVVHRSKGFSYSRMFRNFSKHTRVNDKHITQWLTSFKG
jgi:hypothetical protein